jgi:hypothetical protein
MYNMSVYIDVYMGNKDDHAKEEAECTRTVVYCKQETPNLFGAQIPPEVCGPRLIFHALAVLRGIVSRAWLPYIQDLDESQQSTLESVYQSNPALVVWPSQPRLLFLVNALCYHLRKFS